MTQQKYTIEHDETTHNGHVVIQHPASGSPNDLNDLGNPFRIKPASENSLALARYEGRSFSAA